MTRMVARLHEASEVRFERVCKNLYGAGDRCDIHNRGEPGTGGQQRWQDPKASYVRL